MAANQVFRVYDDEETMLKVYARRLAMADAKFEKRKPLLERQMREYENEVTADEVTDRGHIVNVTSGIGVVDTMFSSMTAVDVEFICRVIGNGTEEQAIASERGLNQAFRDTKGNRRTKKAVKDAIILETGWVKVYYDYVQDVELRERPEDAIQAELDELQGQNPKVSREDLLNQIDGFEEVEVVLRDRICIDYVPWDKVRYDPSAKQVEDARWTAQYTDMPTPEVVNHPTWRAFVIDRYGEREGKRLLDSLESGDGTLLDSGIKYDDVPGLGEMKDTESDDTRIRVVEMWDLETGIVTTFPRNRTDIVLFQRANPLMFNLDLEDRNPFKPFQVRENTREFEGLSDMRVILPSLDELKEYRTNAAQHVARTIPKTMGPDRALSPAGKAALMSTEWNEYVGLEEGYNITDVGPMTPPPLPQETLGMTQVIMAEMREATGLNEPMRGVFPERRTTATETSIVTNAGERRQAERRSALEEWYLDIAKTMLQLMQLFYDRDRMLRYTDDLGQSFLWTWNKEDIAIDADIDIALTPKENKTRAEEFQEAIQVFNLGVAIQEFDRIEGLKLVYRKMGLRDDEIRKLVKTQEEVDEENAEAQANEAALAVKPQPFANSPVGLSIGPARQG